MKGTNVGELVHGKYTKVDRYKWGIRDEVGKFMFIEKDRLLIDREYQRTVSIEKVYKIAMDWSWVAFSVISVAARGDKFFVIDGQHRLEAAMRRADIKELPCMVFAVEDVSVEAGAFLDSNILRKAMYAHDKFKALLVTKNKAALLVDKLVKESGRTFSRNVGKDTIGCVGTMLRVARDSPETLEAVWPIIVEFCYGNSIHERIVESFVYIERRLLNGQSLLHQRWRERLIKIGYDSIIESTARAASFYSRGGASVWSAGVLEALNKGMRTNVLEVENVSRGRRSSSSSLKS